MTTHNTHQYEKIKITPSKTLLTLRKIYDMQYMTPKNRLRMFCAYAYKHRETLLNSGVLDELNIIIHNIELDFTITTPNGNNISLYAIDIYSPPFLKLLLHHGVGVDQTSLQNQRDYIDQKINSEINSGGVTEWVKVEALKQCSDLIDEWLEYRGYKLENLYV